MKLSIAIRPASFDEADAIIGLLQAAGMLLS